MRTQREAEKRFIERLETQSLSNRLQNMKYDRTQTLRKSWDIKRGSGKQWLKSINISAAEAVRSTLRVVFIESNPNIGGECVQINLLT